MGRRTVRLTWLACALLVAAVWVHPAMAHPHVWIGVEARVVYENGWFTGIAQTWSFDEFYSAYAVQQLDTNRDGVYDQGELAELTSEFSRAVANDAYFTTAELPGTAIRFGSPTDFRLDVEDGLLTVSFTLPFSSPVPQGERELRFAVFDPAYFIAFDLTKLDFLAPDGGVPSTCKIRMMSDMVADAPTAPPQTVPDDLSADLMEPFWTVSVACAAP